MESEGGAYIPAPEETEKRRAYAAAWRRCSGILPHEKTVEVAAVAKNGALQRLFRCGKRYFCFTYIPCAYLKKAVMLEIRPLAATL